MGSSGGSNGGGGQGRYECLRRWVRLETTWCVDALLVVAVAVAVDAREFCVKPLYYV